MNIYSDGVKPVQSPKSKKNWRANAWEKAGNNCPGKNNSKLLAKGRNQKQCNVCYMLHFVVSFMSQQDFETRNYVRYAIMKETTWSVLGSGDGF